ncbi:hypothetical protein [Bacillus sp. FJAT-26390]|uniref:hypothetical protein n=1 Tax=Bacillus sp. FJAT-26390 TaxID=1743142 RepID=UPI000807DF45|nr:hypothetical protein [Bacillus sp. FJAT-26390]OBZ11233.1 hypothetical protein A7975_19965 [Bacillus sp. FJAT-26390]
MRKKKWKKILIWVASIIVILGVGGLFAANYAVDKLISTLAADLEKDLLNEEVTAPETKPDQQGTDQTDQGDSNPTDGKDGTTEGSTDNAEKPGKDGSSTTGGDSSEPKEEKPKDKYNGEVTVDKAKDLQEKITVSEKAQVSSVLLKELSMSDIKELQALASGGMTLEEKKKARSIILDKLSPEQYDELIQVAKKYGMSQGKSYDEVIKEK